jgi:hypothetical protein
MDDPCRDKLRVQGAISTSNTIETRTNVCSVTLYGANARVGEGSLTCGGVGTVSIPGDIWVIDEGF